MSLKLDWNKLKQVQKYLLEDKQMTKNTDIVFVVILKDGSATRSVTKFKNFLGFCWAISEKGGRNIYTLVVQDKEGRILYRHKRLTAGNEEVPSGGNYNIFSNWRTLTQKQKDCYIELLIAQIHSHE